MSLKHDIAEYPEMWSKEIVAALEDYKNGKRNSKRKLRKFVNREISEHYYNELIERYAFFHRMNKAKRERKQSRKIKIVLCIILAISILLSALESALDYLLITYEAEFAVLYFFLYLWAIFYAFAYDPNSDKISRLETENKLLKERIEIYKHSNKELEAELEDIRNNSQCKQLTMFEGSDDNE